MSVNWKNFELPISIKDWFNYDPRVGTDSLHIVGYPRTGKSNMSTGLAAQGIAKKKELLIIPGDRFCEWRHFPFHDLLKDIKLTVLVPDGVDIHYEGVRKNHWFVDINYNDIDIFEFLTEQSPILVIYDSHLRLLTGERTNLWVNIFEQALNRRKYTDRAVEFLFHEAGILFPESARDKQWKAVQDFSELFVEAGKGLIRTILVSQLLTEVESTIRNKCMYNVFRQAYVGHKAGFPPPLVKVLPFTPINEYHICKGRGIYKRGNTTKLFYENKSIWKMIPPSSIYRGGTPIGSVEVSDKSQLSIKNGKVYYTPRDNSGKFTGNVPISEGLQ
jgi:hypothetical protein